MSLASFLAAAAASCARDSCCCSSSCSELAPAPLAPGPLSWPSSSAPAAPREVSAAGEGVGEGEPPAAEPMLPPAEVRGESASAAARRADACASCRRDCSSCSSSCCPAPRCASSSAHAASNCLCSASSCASSCSACCSCGLGPRGEGPSWGVAAPDAVVLPPPPLVLSRPSLMDSAWPWPSVCLAAFLLLRSKFILRLLTDLRRRGGERARSGGGRCLRKGAAGGNAPAPGAGPAAGGAHARAGWRAARRRAQARAHAQVAMREGGGDKRAPLHEGLRVAGHHGVPRSPPGGSGRRAGARLQPLLGLQQLLLQRALLRPEPGQHRLEEGQQRLAVGRVAAGRRRLLLVCGPGVGEGLGREGLGRGSRPGARLCA
jgi:hypothetical protein